MTTINATSGTVENQKSESPAILHRWKALLSRRKSSLEPLNHATTAAEEKPESDPHPATDNHTLKAPDEAELTRLKESGDKLVQAMMLLVEESGKLHSEEIPLNSHTVFTRPEHLAALPEESLLGGLISNETLNKIFASQKMGCYVITNRVTGEKEFESMPLFTRIGMHLLFVHVHRNILTSSVIESLFKQLTVRQGRIYDTEDPKVVLANIRSFIKSYNISLGDLLEPNLNKYKTFNAFFSRSLRAGTRPAADPEDPTVITSVADCRLTVFASIADARKFWIKGREFTLASLLDDPALAKTFRKASLAIFRLAPQDYHRYHSPAAAIVGKISQLPGQYYTVNPQAVNEDLDVFTANRRDICSLSARLSNDEKAPPTTLALVAVGALLVGSVKWAKTPGESVQKGENLGWFQYGGSTCILVAPQGSVVFDQDILDASRKGIEVLVRVGERIGKGQNVNA